MKFKPDEIVSVLQSEVENYKDRLEARKPAESSRLATVLPVFTVYPM